MSKNALPDTISGMAELFLNQKHMTGFKYEWQEKCIRRFVAFYDREGYTGIRLTKPMIESFIYDISEKPSTHYHKETLLRDFAEFLKAQGFQKIYVPIVHSGSYRCTHIPYIFTDDEMKLVSFEMVSKASTITIDERLFRYKTAISCFLFFFRYALIHAVHAVLAVLVSPASHPASGPFRCFNNFQFLCSFATCSFIFRIP